MKKYLIWSKVGNFEFNKEMVGMFRMNFDMGHRCYEFESEGLTYYFPINNTIIQEVK